ncbi:MAG TPA: glycosyltransferase family A protein [Acidobacteriota bacterium]|nr:glycosyltransferase family A protein [Acidobacteriota bacterium]
MDAIQLSERVAVIVTMRDRFSMFSRCLESLYKNTNIPFRVIVVVGGANTEIRDYLKGGRTGGNLTTVFTKRLLLQGEARNIGMREVGERFCVILENDTLSGSNGFVRSCDVRSRREQQLLLR